MILINKKIYMYIPIKRLLRRKADQLQQYITTELGQLFCVTDVILFIFDQWQQS